MVRQIITMCLLSVCLLVASPTQAFAYDIYDSGNISSTYSEIFRDVLNNVHVGFNDYVFFRSGQYEYAMVVGDLEFDNGEFVADEVDIYELSYSSSGYNQSSYTYELYTDSDFYLDASSELVYSNLGYYPDLIERESYYDYATLYIIIIICVCALIRSIFKYTYRSRSRY